MSFFLKPMYATTLGAAYRWQDKYLFRFVIDNPPDQKNYIAIAGERVSGTGVTPPPGINARFSKTILL